MPLSVLVCLSVNLIHKALPHTHIYTNTHYTDGALGGTYPESRTASLSCQSCGIKENKERKGEKIETAKTRSNYHKVMFLPNIEQRGATGACCSILLLNHFKVGEKTNDNKVNIQMNATKCTYSYSYSILVNLSLTSN